MVTLFSERNLQECGATMQADANESLKPSSSPGPRSGGPHSGPGKGC